MKAQTPNNGQLMLRIASGIARHGLFVVSVGSGSCDVPGCNCTPEPQPWCYTVGLCELQHPELVVVGLPPETAHHVMTWAYERAQVGKPLEPRIEYKLDHVGVKLVELPPEWLAADPSRMALWLQHYGPGRNTLVFPRVAQLLWADADGHFPDDPACDSAVRELQPVLATDPVAFPPRQSRSDRQRSARKRIT